MIIKLPTLVKSVTYEQLFGYIRVFFGTLRGLPTVLGVMFETPLIEPTTFALLGVARIEGVLSTIADCGVSTHIIKKI